MPVTSLLCKSVCAFFPNYVKKKLQKATCLYPLKMTGKTRSGLIGKIANFYNLAASSFPWLCLKPGIAIGGSINVISAI